VTASEALAVTGSGTLTHVIPGSWINANFDIWLGSEEDNRAWELLNDARDFFALRSGDPSLDPAKVKLAEQEVWIAEGSDWCWWYGPEHSSAHDAEFDLRSWNPRRDSAASAPLDQAQPENLRSNRFRPPHIASLQHV
jgi:alpha-amylase/alpha-mannosidase (GH57 family)